ncbi:MAG TPA: amylo-alpha-1,6-glucosidase [Phycisphaerae bacterium]|nr:amylo-alpha-1,6-glucosidase [Phycisphaerae bacterium]HNU46578.1 amylo-alpha-1,6-glucosidase [Phycisphaerae bacterium]
MNREAEGVAVASGCRLLEGSLEQRLEREWLLTNSYGGFASGTVLGCPTRRYHGLLCAPRRPPLVRYVLLASLLEQVNCGGQEIPLSTFEFPGTFHPEGHRLLQDFAYNLTEHDPWVRFTFEHERFAVEKRVQLARDAHVVRVRYAVRAYRDEPIVLRVSPLIAMRSIHDLRHQPVEDPWLLNEGDKLSWVQLRADRGVTLAIFTEPKEQQGRVHFRMQPVWWHNFRYREELARSFPGGEDLQNLGTFDAAGVGSVAMELVAVGLAGSPLEAIETAESTRQEAKDAGARIAVPDADPVATALHAAADQFVVRCGTGRRAGGTTVLAGYHWFTDWGRDALIALEGLLLIPRRFGEARQVLVTFAGAQQRGLIPNRFNDAASVCDYNSVDASLWFLHAADAYLRYANDLTTYDEVLWPACCRVIQAFLGGTDFDIRVDESGLVYCGNPGTQITWMDAKANGTVFTPRHGAPVEVNALWYSGLRTLADRERTLGRTCPVALATLITRVEESFASTFWREDAQWLYDCVRPGQKDGALRPNQILAVSLPYSPLRDAAQRRAVLEAVQKHLWTPMGLRTLAPFEPGYRGRYEGGPYQRDSAYHNGTVWAWLTGPFIEAYLRVHDWSAEAKNQARAMLEPLINHLYGEAGVGSISEIFDGDPPHKPRGCIAQAWSVAEVLRAYQLTRGR